jgi:hypothetical protein
MNAQYMALSAQYVALADGKFFSEGDRGEPRRLPGSKSQGYGYMYTCTAVWPMFHFMT